MNRRWLAWGCLLLLHAGARAQEERPAGPLVNALLQRLTLAAGMQAEFMQVNQWLIMDEPDSAWGTLTLAPPHRFRLAYTRPAGHLIGCDGEYVWTVIPEERQVLRAAWTETTDWGSFFVRTLTQAADSAATILGGPDETRIAQLRLGARPEWGVADIAIEIDLASGLPTAYGYTDQEGNRSRFHFLEVGFPENLPADRLQFSVPDGYELIDVD